MKWFSIFLSLCIIIPCNILSDTDDQPFSPAFRSGFFSGNRTEKVPDQTVSNVLDEANRSFSYKGKPIHPKLIQHFEPWASDIHPVIFAVDVSAAYDANQFHDEITIDDGLVKYSKMDGWFAYRHTSFHSDSDIHVIHSFSSEGGSYVQKTVFHVRFEIWNSFFPDGTPYDQLILRLVRML